MEDTTHVSRYMTSFTDKGQEDDDEDEDENTRREIRCGSI
jgi:hypothetical protein